MAIARNRPLGTRACRVDPLTIRGAEWARFPRAHREEMVRAAWRYWRQSGFPHYQLSGDDIALEFNRLLAQDTKAAFGRAGALGSVVGLRLANFFQPGMWSVRVGRYRSPMDVFRDDELLGAAIERAWTIWPDRYGANSSTLRRMLKTFPSTASVSNFRPTLARAVMERYSPAGSTVLDFSAGFGGRLTGCLTLERNYIGIEPNADQVIGSRSTVSALIPLRHRRATAEIVEGCAEDLLPQLPARFATLVFSSPPYFNWERYSDSPNQEVSFAERILRRLARGISSTVHTREPTHPPARRIASGSGRRLCRWLVQRESGADSFTCGTTGRSRSLRSLRRGLEKASAWSFPHCSPGRERPHLRHQGRELGKDRGISRQDGHVCFKFSPVEDGSSSRFNPLAEVRLFTPRDVSDAQNIADMIIRSGEDSPMERHWEERLPR